MGCGCKQRGEELRRAQEAMRQADLKRAAEHIRNVGYSAKLDAMRAARTAYTRIDRFARRSQ